MTLMQKQQNDHNALVVIMILNVFPNVDKLYVGAHKIFDTGQSPSTQACKDKQDSESVIPSYTKYELAVQAGPLPRDQGWPWTGGNFIHLG